jgi:hypothetical protein
MKLSKPLIAVLTTGALALGGAGLWLALPGASAAPTVPLTAVNAVASTATAATAATPPKRCETESWPPAATGQPAGDVAGGTRGYYLWHDALGWHLEVTHPTTDHVVFSGWFTSNGTIAFQRVDDERNDITREGPNDHLMSFVFNNYGGLDGVHFETHCADWIQFHLFVDGVPAGVDQVYVGQGSAHPLEMPFTIDRTGVH